MEPVLKMFDKKLYFRAITSFYFGMRKNAVGTTKKICDVHSDGVIDDKNVPVSLSKLLTMKRPH